MTEAGTGSLTEGGRRVARPGRVLATVCLCQLMVVLDISVVNVALPEIGQDLGFALSELSWVVNAYTLVFGGLLLLGGRIADLFGHRRAVIAGLLLFGVASLLGGFAQTPGQLVAARAGQGLAAAVLAPISLTVIMVTFEEGAPRRRALGSWSMVAISGGALGVLLGGVLTDLLDWRWVMFVNVPLVALALPLALASVRNGGGGSQRLDLGGALLGTAAMTVLVFGLLETEKHPWDSLRTLGTLGAASVLAVGFVLWERRSAAPLVRLSVFATRTVWLANLLALLVGAATVAGFYFASLFLQHVLDYGPLAAGVAFLPFCGGAVLGSFAASRLVGRVDGRLLIGGGLAMGGVGLLWFGSLSPESTFLSGFLGPSLVASVGIGLSLMANTAMGTSGVASGEAGLVSGLLNASRQCGGSIGLAALSTLAVTVTGNASTADPTAALAAGYARAFLVVGTCALAAALLAVCLVPRPGASETEKP
ncbi:drug resistance transporter, EmrB/QacA subfamily [Streptomyces zhaozhouensis]|uniref:Drug resistance transporter, EmrB/QacA subfamily n=1 Tax=Streptomyces zhaozhouensis TaxID=1300267 RepID=A0A286DVR7_9ACTN|nr:MFS transporter [Streptomyces zhaozhouensis]SOD62779.1 drug resistance transporter, EmrB/QacA subfamily [Streptomyces zhaozhouensis]